VIAIVGPAPPLASVLDGDGPVPRRLGRIAPHVAQLGEAPDPHGSLRRQVHIVRQMAREVVGAELVLGIEALRQEVLRPLLQHRPVAVDHSRVAPRLRQGREEDEHVARLLHRHLVLLARRPAPVHLTVREGVLPYVVGREGEGPEIRGRVLQHRHDRRLHQRGTGQEQDGRLGIEHVHRARAAVAEVLLREEERPPRRVGHELARGEGLAEGQGADGRVLGAAAALQVRHEFAVESLAPSRHLGGVAQGIGDEACRVCAVAAPEGPKVAAEVLHAVVVIVSDDHRVADLRGAHGA